MKKVFVFCMFAICAMFVAFSASAKTHYDTNDPMTVIFDTQKDVSFDQSTVVSFDIEKSTVSDTFTGKYYVAKDGTKYAVYQGSRGGYYVNRTSKAGKEYKQYLKPEVVAKL